MPLTLEEIAKEAGVSRSTVSRVLNHHPNVSADARERVLTITRRLNFQPNVLARSLAGGRTGVLGLVIPMGVSTLFTDPYFPLVIQGISTACNTRDYSVMLWLAEPEQERRTINKVLHGGLIDGVIVASSLVDDSLVAALLERGLPFVQIGRHPQDERVSYVDVDNKAAVREMISYMLRLGYNRVATIAGPANMIGGIDRLEGYMNALREWGMPIDRRLITHGDFSEASGYAAMVRLLPCEPDAVFCGSDTMAVGALRALREAGKRVPDDIGIAGFDDIPYASRIDPPLTTIRQPISRTGSVAAENCIALIEQGGLRSRRVILPTELVIRSSLRAS